VAELLLTNAIAEAKVLKEGDSVISNRPFESTMGHIKRNGWNVKALCKLTTPEDFIETEQIFLGDITPEMYEAEPSESF